MLQAAAAAMMMTGDTVQRRRYRRGYSFFPKPTITSAVRVAQNRCAVVVWTMAVPGNDEGPALIVIGAHARCFRRFFSYPAKAVDPTEYWNARHH